MPVESNEDSCVRVRETSLAEILTEQDFFHLYFHSTEILYSLDKLPYYTIATMKVVVHCRCKTNRGSTVLITVKLN